MAAWLKIAIKTGIALVVSAAVFVLFAVVKLPVLDLSFFSQVGTFLAVAEHYCLALTLLLPFLGALLALELAIEVVRLALIVVRWVLKVNE